MYIVAPEKTKRFASFIVGWISVVGWWIVTASGVSLAATSTFGMVQFWLDDFLSHSWMIYLVFVAVVLMTGTLNPLRVIIY